MKNRYKIIFLLFISSLVFSSCENLFNVDPEEVLLEEDYLGVDQIEARSALFGVLGQMQDVSKQYLVLGELRADLMDVTEESVDELRQINEHNVADGNSLTDPTELFSIINNCNFALHGIDTVAFDNELLNVYASLLRVRTWAQLQIAINYGKLPFITKPISSVDDLNEDYPLLSFEQAMLSLIEVLLPYQLIDNESDYENSLNFTIYKMIPDKDILLGDLYLAVNNYTMAATYYKEFMDRNVSGGGSKYNLTSTYGISAANASSAVTINWINIFGEDIADNEVVTYIPFSLQYRQPNTAYALVDDYQVRPSENIINNWSSQVRLFADDTYGLGDYRLYCSTTHSSNGFAINKYQYDYITIGRAANVYLKYAEAINRAGYPLHALYMLNQGPKTDTTVVEAPRFIDNAQSYLNFTQSAYYTISSGKSVNGNLGVRGRAGLAPAEIINAATFQDSITQVEMLILNESALETAFEGNRWSDLMRISTRNNDNSILANAVANKFLATQPGMASTITAKLMDSENWFLKLDEDSNFISGSN
jgi:hypothetical protein